VPTSTVGHLKGSEAPVTEPGLHDVAANPHSDALSLTAPTVTALARDSATEAPTLADVAPLLDRLPTLATSLDTAPQAELRALFDALQLDVIFQPTDSTVDVAVTFYDRGGGAGVTAAQVPAEDWLAPPEGFEPS
jgi:hypothetical protein